MVATRKQLIPVIRPLVSISYEPDGDDGCYRYTVWVNGVFAFGEHMLKNRRAAERDCERQLRARGLK